MVLLPLLKGVLFGVIGFLAGASLAYALRVLMGLDPWSPEALVTVGYALGLAGWLRFANLDALGYANHYYTAGVASMLESWRNFYFAAAEPGGENQRPV